MANDRIGSIIHIPSFFISRIDGQKIKDAIDPGTRVYIRASVDIHHPNNRVEYDLWYSTIFDLDYYNFEDVAML